MCARVWTHAVEVNVRRQGIGQALVKMCEDLSVEWGHNVLFLHVEESNKAAIDFYATLGFSEATRDLSWYDTLLSHRHSRSSSWVPSTCAPLKFCLEELTTHSSSIRYDRIGREDLQQQKQKLLYKMLQAPDAGQGSMIGTTATGADADADQGDSVDGGATPATTGKGPLS